MSVVGTFRLASEAHLMLRELDKVHIEYIIQVLNTSYDCRSYKRLLLIRSGGRTKNNNRRVVVKP